MYTFIYLLKKYDIIDSLVVWSNVMLIRIL
jgi:hypothetical protein